LEDIRTDEGVSGVRAAAVVAEAREITIADQLEAILDGGDARSVVGAEPVSVPVRAARDAHSISVGVESEALGASSRAVELRLHGRRTAVEAGSFFVDAGDGEVTKELNRSSILNSGVQVLGGAVSINVGEEV
jgi:hypothetical protein